MASKVLTQNDLLNVLAHINLGDDGHMELTQAEFDQLTQEEKDDGTIYFITDGVSGNVFLDDNTPIGTIAPYGGTSDPTYWLICDGRAISRTTYADLFAVIGTTYGSGNGSTTFNIPDLRGKVPMGTTTGYAMGSTGGEVEHILQTSEIPAHTHGSKSLTGSFAAYRWGNGSTSGIMTVTGNTLNMDTIGSGTKIAHTSYTVNATHEHTSVGEGAAHNNLQPYTVTNYIIKAQSAVSESQSHLDMFYPVGSYYETSDSTFNPNIRWGGTWELETEGQVHIGAGENYEIGDTGGEATHTLIVNEMPSHTHTMFYTGGSTTTWGYNYTSSGGTRSAQTEASGGIGPTGGGQAHNNMQPYIVVNRWHRTA